MGRRMVIPSIEEVQDYIDKKGYDLVDAVEFWHFYEAKGWKVGKEPMKVWRSAVAYWQQTRKQRGEKPVRRVPIRGDPDFEGRF